MWTKGHELKYWNKNGLKKGKGIYYNYFKAFELDKYDFDGKIIADLGCGPFGGIFSYLKNNSSHVMPMDILAEEYNEMSVCDKKIIFSDLNKRVSLDNDYCDYIICTNAIDHIKDVSHGFNEIYRSLKVGGIAFVHVHLRTKEQLNKAHVHVLTEKILRQHCYKFNIIKLNVDDDWVNGRHDRKAAYLVLEKNFSG